LPDRENHQNDEDKTGWVGPPSDQRPVLMVGNEERDDRVGYDVRKRQGQTKAHNGWYGQLPQYEC